MKNDAYYQTLNSIISKRIHRVARFFLAESGFHLDLVQETVKLRKCLYYTLISTHCAFVKLISLTKWQILVYT